MCNAYSETVLFVFIYSIYSSCLIAIDLPVWPTYDMLHVLHCNLYIPLEFVLFCFEVVYHRVDGKRCYVSEMLCLGRCV